MDPRSRRIALTSATAAIALLITGLALGSSGPLALASATATPTGTPSPSPSPSPVAVDPSLRGPAATANASPPSAGRCAKVTSRSFRGTIQTEDGRAINATVAFDIFDASNHKIDLRTGCRIGNAYSSVVQVNHWITADGAPFGTLMLSRGKTGDPEGYVTDAFVLEHLPANAKRVYIETYTRDYAGCAPFVYTGVSRTTGQGTFTGCTGKTDLDRYGRATRRNMLITGSPRLVLPLTAKYGGSTGTITVIGAGISSIYTRSEAPDGKLRLQGWGTGNPLGGNRWQIPALASGQTYIVQVFFTNGREKDRTHVKVNSRRNTTITV
jgi:hypothetical protein